MNPRAVVTPDAWLAITACGAVVIVSEFLIAGLFRKRVDDTNDVERRNPVAAVAWIYVGVAVTVVILIGSFIGTMVTLARASRPAQGAALTLDITGHQWWWEVRYSDSLPSHGSVTANAIHIPVGRPVRVRLHGADVIHSFWIPELAGKTDVIPGQTNEAWFDASTPGEYRRQCAEYCGLEHAKIAAIVFADPAARYEAWAATERASALAPTDSMSRVGEQVFVRSCSACHAVRGTGTEGRVGPDLTHFASRTTIAAGALTNTEANLGDWIRDPQRAKPGAFMPTVPIADSDVATVAVYLRALR